MNVVRVLVVTYCRPKHLTETLERLQDQTQHIDRLIVIDNDPEQGAEGVVRLFGPRLDYLPSGENLGPAGALSLGLEVAVSDGFRGWILFVDDDNYPPDNRTLESLVSLGDSARYRDPRVVAVGLTGARFDRSRAIMRRIPDPQLSGEVDVDVIGGGQFPLYWSDALKEVGGPDASLFFGLDDLELGLRLRRRDWRLVIDGDRLLRLRAAKEKAPGSSERKPVTDEKEAPWRRYYSVRNLIVVSRRYCSWSGIALATFGPLIKCVSRLLRREPRAWTNCLASGRGAVDGWRGRMGRSVEPT